MNCWYILSVGLMSVDKEYSSSRLRGKACGSQVFFRRLAN